MPVFEIERNGKVYEVDAPDMNAALKGFSQSGVSKPGVAEDVARTVPAGLARGAVSTLFGLGDLSKLATGVIDRVTGYVAGVDPQAIAAARETVPALSSANTMTSGQVNKALTEAVPALGYKPQTTVGEYANTAAEFAPGMLLGSGGLASRAAQTFIPAVASETAGQVTRQVAPAAEPYARLGGALAGAGIVGAVQRPNTPAALLRDSMQGVDDATITAARGLIDDAAGQGVQLTWPEAIQQVTGGGTRLGAMQRVVENSAGGAPVMAPYMAARPGQVQAAGNRVIGDIAPQQLDPLTTGLNVQRAATGTIDDTQQAINAATRPAYRAAEAARIPAQQYQGLAADPLYAHTLQGIRNDPALNRTIAALPDDSVGVVDLVQRRMRETAENARVPGQASTSNLAAGNYENARAPAIQAAEAATGGAQGPYAVARQAQEQLRRTELEPLTAGPMGALARSDDVMSQARALLPNQPPAGIDATVSQTVRQIVRRDPDAAQNLVRTYAQTVFDEAISRNPGGANQFGGAKFAAVIAGNPQQARNLEAAVRALPGGHQRWEGFRRFLDVLEATGQRQQTGSATAFNQEIQQQLRAGGGVGEVANAVATGGVKVPSRLKDWYEQLRLGRNTEGLARIFTDPAAEPLLRRLANETPGTARSQALAARLTYLAERGANTTPALRE